MVDDVTFLALLPYRMFKQYDTRRQNLKADVSPLWGTCKKHTCSKRSRVILPGENFIFFAISGMIQLLYN